MIAGPGTYPLGVNYISTAGGIAMVAAPQGSSFATWSTNLSGSGGTLTVTSLTSARIVGTFQFTPPPQTFSSTTGTRVVTQWRVRHAVTVWGSGTTGTLAITIGAFSVRIDSP